MTGGPTAAGREEVLAQLTPRAGGQHEIPRAIDTVTSLWPG
ncbi:hypothetical protein ACFYU9_05155 [Streptomyces sp. NPDC004327]